MNVVRKTFVCLLMKSSLALGIVGIASAQTPVSIVEITNQFFKSCIGSLPDFKALGPSLVADGFVNSPTEKAWRKGAVIVTVQESPERFICIFGINGNHTEALTAAVSARLEDGKLGPHELRESPGRTLHILTRDRGPVFVEVMPPFDKSTFIATSSPK